MKLSLEASLKRLRTTYVDIMYLHWWDHTTSIEEIMDGLHNLVTQGKALYLVRFYLIYHWSAHSNVDLSLGSLKHTCIPSSSVQPVRKRPWKVTVRDLPGRVECPQTRRRKGDPSVMSS